MFGLIVKSFLNDLFTALTIIAIILVSALPAGAKAYESDNLSPTAWVLFVDRDEQRTINEFGTYTPVKIYRTREKCVFLKQGFLDEYPNAFWCEELPIELKPWDKQIEILNN